MVPSRYQIKMRGKLFQAERAGGPRPETGHGTGFSPLPKGWRTEGNDGRDGRREDEKKVPQSW